MYKDVETQNYPRRVQVGLCTFTMVASDACA